MDGGHRRRPLPDAHVRLIVTVADGAVIRFAAEVDGIGRFDGGPPFTATPGGWIGATLALFATGPAGGTADFDPFRVTSPTGR